MDVSPTALLTSFLPKLPGILLTSLLALLGYTANSSAQDAVTQIIVAAARPILRTPAKVGRSQRVWLRLGVWSAWVLEWVGWVAGSLGVERWVEVWCGAVVRWEVLDVLGIDEGVEGGSEAKEKGKVMCVREAVAYAFDVLQDPKHGEAVCPMPALADVEVEWTTPRAQARVSNKAVEEKLKPKLDTSSTRLPVILYLHGGAHCLMDPTTHRWTTSTLSNLSNAQVCTVRFRLSPQHPFPAALLDAFVTYLSLLSPAPTSTRGAFQPSQIVLAGDSSGGGLAASLLLLLLTLSRHKIDIIFHGRRVRLANPPCAGLALTSPWLDITRSLPSTVANERWDIIAPPPIDSASPPFPPDETWPTSPPRAETYCVADMCTHPLVSPLGATPAMWAGAPLTWVCGGWEGFTDEIEVFARRVFSSSEDARVVFEGWEGMPHCFGMVPWNWAGWEAMISWAEFCGQVVRERVERKDVAVWKATVGDRKGLCRQVKLSELGCHTDGVGYVRERPLTDELVDELMEKGREWRIGLENEMVRKCQARRKI